MGTGLGVSDGEERAGALSREDHVLEISCSDLFAVLELPDDPLQVLAALVHIVYQFVPEWCVVLEKIGFQLLGACADLHDCLLILAIKIDSIWSHQVQSWSDWDDWNPQVVLLDDRSDQIIDLVVFPWHEDDGWPVLLEYHRWIDTLEGIVRLVNLLHLRLGPSLEWAGRSVFRRTRVHWLRQLISLLLIDHQVDGRLVLHLFIDGILVL